MGHTAPDPLADDSRPYVPPNPGRLTEAEFVAWCDEWWAEWVDGEVVLGAFDVAHAEMHGFLRTVMYMFVRHHELGQLFSTRFQVRFAEQRRRRSPDLFFVAREHAGRIQEYEVEGAPDLIVEVVGEGSQARDWREKYHEYEVAGVREYWVVDSATGYAEAYELVEGRFRRIAEMEGKIASRVLPGFYLRPEWLRARPLPVVQVPLREMGVIG